MQQEDLESAGFIVVRTPLLPFRDFSELPRQAGLPASAPLTLPDTDAARSALRRGLRAAFDRPLVQDALLSASPSLYERIFDWLPSSRTAKAVKTQHALVKYFSRMTYRCTPFGLLAGFSWARPSLPTPSASNAAIVLASADSYRRNGRIDMGAVAQLSSRLLADVEVRRRLSYFPNPTLHRRTAQWQYIEARDHDGRRRFELSAVDETPHLNALLLALESRDTPAHFDELVEQLTAIAPDAGRVEIEEFIDVLIDNAVLLSSLEPPLTGGDPLPHLVEALAACRDHGGLAKLRAVQALLADLNNVRLGADPRKVIALRAQIHDALDKISGKDFLQMDLQKPVEECIVPEAVVGDVKAAIAALRKLSFEPQDGLRSFRTSFQERYGERSVPLLEVLDPDSGIAIGNDHGDQLPLLDGIALAPGGAAEVVNSDTSPVAQLLVREFERACRENRDEIILSEEHLQSLSASTVSSPAQAANRQSFFVIATLLGANAAPDGSPRIVIRGVGGSSGAHLIGRFCCSDEGLATETINLLQLEEAAEADVIHAEIVHWPVNRVGNVILRPRLRSRELPIFGRAMAPRSQQIQLRDLLVSLRDSKVLLHTRTTGERVVPRLSNAHNTHYNSVALYTFLSALQYQDIASPAFQWPTTLLAATRLPRVVYGNCVLSPRMWLLGPAQLSQLQSLSEHRAYCLLQDWRRTLRWDRFIELADGDNCLCVDLDNPICVDCLADELMGRTSAMIREVFAPDAQGVVKGPEGAFCHEIVLPFVRRTQARAEAIPSPDRRTASNAAATELRLQHPPGSEWLYMKIYTGSLGAERIITEYLAPLVERLFSRGLVERWFFLRYRDTAKHLRVRFRGEPAKLWGQVVLEIRELLSPALDQLASSMTFDTYEPEIDRYGGAATIEVTERIFHADSNCALELIAGGHLNDPDWRWKWIAYGTDLFWRAAGFDIQARLDLYRSLGAGTTGSQLQKANKIAIDQKFRAARADLDGLLFGELLRESPVRSLFDRRSAELWSHLLYLRQLDHESGGLSSSLQQIIGSHVHMSINRLCITANSAQETVIYEMLARLLLSRIARRDREPA